MVDALRKILVAFLSVLIIGTGSGMHASEHDANVSGFLGETDCGSHRERLVSDSERAHVSTHGHVVSDVDIASDQQCSVMSCPFVSAGHDAVFVAKATRRIVLTSFSDEELVSNPLDMLRRPPKA